MAMGQKLALTVGTTMRQADYATGSGTTALSSATSCRGRGRAAPASLIGGEDLDVDGISVGTGALTLNGGAINDARDSSTAANLGLRASTLSNDLAHRVNGGDLVAPTVAGVTVESTSPADGAYASGAAIRVRVSFNRAVQVTGAPTLALMIGSQRRLRGKGTTDLVFRYAVQPGDADPDGFSVPADALSLNGGTIALAGGSASGTSWPGGALGHSELPN